jgi:hypothetical protein
MQTVVGVKVSKWQTKVECPYCLKKHLHGNAGKDFLNNDYRSAHCHKGEYKIVKDSRDERILTDL